MQQENNNNSCFEWIQLFITISIPVAIGVYTILESKRDFAIETHNRKQDLYIADDQQKDLILHECQKTLSKLIEKYGTKLNKSSSASIVARFTTLSALNRLDSNRRNFLVRLLYEAKLITYRSDDYQPPVSLQSANLTDLNLIDDDSEQRILVHLSLEGTIMTRADFHEINIRGARFRDAILINADFSWTWNSPTFDDEMNTFKYNSSKLFFDNANLTSASFFSATYDNVDFTRVIMIHANLHMFFCVNCLFDSVTMIEVNLENAAIENSSFMFAKLDYANLYRSKFGLNVDFYETIMNNVNGAYTNFTKCALTKTKLMNSIFDYGVFIDSTFSYAYMYKVSMKYCRVINGNFTGADLSYSDWRYAHCERCIFNQANLTNANLFGATFIKSDFRYSEIVEKQLLQTASLEWSMLSI
ncbi:unnamed protein product [Rotaria sp. Silwood1]|nr:unnamed protein product [Rotaria sp. Silwood1]CAF1632721.1 unnamed protein product [Rotaria sp. Silwood1]CAF1632897.1 unnamed protein product [Rotaria sp. Silwood1]CAF3735887.1 unnamed protein product [Rotaria sp. Silwood1]CAF3854514.1 unnamed protein product [Rotaria sp. Silwood1]